MSPYRLPPAQPRPAPAAPWWRVAWAVLSRGLTRRRSERAMRCRALGPFPLPEMLVRAAGWRGLHPFTRRRLLDALDQEREKFWLSEARVWRLPHPWRREDEPWDPPARRDVVA